MTDNMSISLKSNQLKISLLLARRLNTKELYSIKIPKDEYDISCEFTFENDKKLILRDNISIENCIEIILDKENTIICHKDSDYINKLYYIIYKAINYRRYGDVNKDYIIERDIIENVAKSIATYCTLKDIYRLEYLIDVADYSHYSLPFKLISNVHFSFTIENFICCFNIYEDGVKRHNDTYYFQDIKLGRSKLELILQKIKSILKEESSQ